MKIKGVLFPLTEYSALLTKARNLIMKKEAEEEETSPGPPAAGSMFASFLTSPDVEDDNRPEKSYRGSGNVTVHNCEDYVNR